MVPASAKENERPTRVRLRLGGALRLTDEQFAELCHLNRDLRIERPSEEVLSIMPPTGGATGSRNAEIIRQLANWAKQDATGRVFDSSTGFALPTGARRSPDAAWVTRERLAALTDEQKEGLLPLCPDFVIELRSRYDSLTELQEKLMEYIQNGARLGWLIDPETQTVYVYRPGSAVDVVAKPIVLTGDPELPGFVLDLQDIWLPPI